jgi:hypothetical protein
MDPFHRELQIVAIVRFDVFVPLLVEPHSLFAAYPRTYLFRARIPSLPPQRQRNERLRLGFPA